MMNVRDVEYRCEKNIDVRVWGVLAFVMGEGINGLWDERGVCKRCGRLWRL